MRIVIVMIAALFGGHAGATLPPAPDAAKAQAAEAAAKTAWSDKVALYQLCVAEERTAEAYRTSLKASAKPVPSPVATPSCTDPGPYTPITPVTAKPLEASGAHSPPGSAISPPSTPAPAAEITGTKK